MHFFKHSKKAFSMVELLMLLLISSLIIAALTPIVTRKHLKNPITAKHGTYMCYYKTNNTPGANQGKVMLYEKQLSGAINPSTVKEGQVSQCVFNPPKKASYFQITAIGGGGGGSDAGYKGGAPSIKEEKSDLSPFGIEVKDLDNWGMRTIGKENKDAAYCYSHPSECFSEFISRAGEVYAYARGFASGDGGKIGYMGLETSTGKADPEYMTTGEPSQYDYLKYSSIKDNEDGTYEVTYRSKVPKIELEYKKGDCQEWVEDKTKCKTIEHDKIWICTKRENCYSEPQGSANFDQHASGTYSNASTKECPCIEGHYETQPPTEQCDLKCAKEGASVPTGEYNVTWVDGAYETVTLEKYYVNTSAGTARLPVEYDIIINPNYYYKEWYDLVYETNDYYRGHGASGASVTTKSIHGGLMLDFTPYPGVFTTSNISTFVNNKNGEDYQDIIGNKTYDSSKSIDNQSFADLHGTGETKIYAADGRVFCDTIRQTQCNKKEDAARSVVEIYQCKNGDCNTKSPRYKVSAGSAWKAGTGAGRYGETLPPDSERKSPRLLSSNRYYDSPVTKYSNGESGDTKDELGNNGIGSNSQCTTSTTTDSDVDYYMGYCLKHWSPSGAVEIEPNGLYKYKRTFDMNYLSKGHSGSPGEFVTVVIRSLANVDRTIHIGRGGSGAQLNSGADGSKGSATYMGATPNSALVYAAGGDGGRGKEPDLPKRLPRFDRDRYNAHPEEYTNRLQADEGTLPLKKSAGGMFNFVLSAFRNDDVIEKIIENAGKGGRGGGVEHRCWAGQDVIEFEGQEISSLSVYPFGSGKPNSLLCDPSDPDNFSNLAAGPGSDGALIIRW